MSCVWPRGWVIVLVEVSDETTRDATLCIVGPPLPKSRSQFETKHPESFEISFAVSSHGRKCCLHVVVRVQNTEMLRLDGGQRVTR